MKKKPLAAEDWKTINSIPWPADVAACLAALEKKCGPITAEEISAAVGADLNGIVTGRMSPRINLVFVTLELPYRFFAMCYRGSPRRWGSQQFCMIKMDPQATRTG